MDKKTADAITKLLRWTLTQMKELESEIAALENTLQAYPLVLDQQLNSGQPFKFEADGQIKLLQLSVELARKNDAIQGPIRQKYDTFLAKIRERPVDVQTVEAALKEFETLKLKTGQKAN
jgi:hypothetical protein